MSAFNSTRSIVAAQVNAAFNISIKDSAGQTTPVLTVLKSLQTSPYEYGLFAEQDIRVLTSMIYALRNELVRLQYVADRPVQDQPHEGSLEANDTGRPDENALEREEAIKQVAYEVAVLERHLVSLDKQAAADLEEAGSRQADGGRFRFMRRNQSYRSYVNTWEEWLADQKAEALPGSTWLMKLEKAQDEVTLPHVTAQEANDTYREFLQDDRLERSSHRAWDNIRDTLTEIGQELFRHADAMERLNQDLAGVAAAYDDPKVRDFHSGQIKADMAMETKLHRQNLNRPVWLLGMRMQPVALLAHTGVPKELINSCEWRTEESKRRADAAKAKAAEVNAQMLEMQANMAELQANTMLLQMQQQMAEMQKQFNQQMAQFKAISQPVKQPKADKPAKQAKQPKADKPAKSSKSLASGIQTHTTRGAAVAGFRPRG